MRAAKAHAVCDHLVDVWVARALYVFVLRVEYRETCAIRPIHGTVWDTLKLLTGIEERPMPWPPTQRPEAKALAQCADHEPLV